MPDSDIEIGHQAAEQIILGNIRDARDMILQGATQKQAAVRALIAAKAIDVATWPVSGGADRVLDCIQGW